MSAHYRPTHALAVGAMVAGLTPAELAIHARDASLAPAWHAKQRKPRRYPIRTARQRRRAREGRVPRAVRIARLAGAGRKVSGRQWRRMLKALRRVRVFA